jgi:predicted nucleotidyltransferase component of viral defense system
MAFSEAYRKQVALLVRALPAVAAERCFALKGGTAINLFVRDLPRLSVDIDLTYVPVQSRVESLAAIDEAMKRIAVVLRASIRGSQVTEQRVDSMVGKLFVRADGVQIKIEVTPVTRGCVYDPVDRTVTPVVEAEFGFAEIQVVSFPDLYAGKIVAALDRQHPRDLFDVRDLLANEGITPELRRAFITYMISHNRPIAEVLDPRLKDLDEEYARGFVGMTVEPVDVAELEKARTDLIAAVVSDMPQGHRRFLVGFEKGQPDWELLGLDGVKDLPAVIWRQHNLDSLKEEVRTALVASLERALKMSPGGES